MNIIVAVAKNNAIGKNNNLLWHIKEDLVYFKKTTLGATVVMGGKLLNR
ncbi:Dihydrofolate reductase type 3 [bioreactor metagenome]|uniref:dihydrofolate reductase n=1 Tax=bioreactor metagenome TaxID=1076179 RepID=A0A645A1C9_9ZZZZ